MQANVLMVDDRPENLLALRAILEVLDCHLVEAHSGTEALKHLLGAEFALILMDVQMPGLDGFETASIIKEREKTRHVPIIFVTAISKEQNYVFQGYSSGAVDYISKPFDPNILRSKVSVFIDLWQKSEQIKQQAELVRRNEQLERERQMAALERDLERRHLAELAASEARLSRFKSTLDATLDSVLIFDPETLRYSYVNQGALRHLGYSSHEMSTLTPVAIQPDGDEKQFRRLLQPLRDGHQPSLRREEVHRRHDGTLVPVEVFFQFIAPEGEEGRFVSIVRDISERKAAEAALITAKEIAEAERARAESASLAKSEFIAGVSHELRTPLNAIIGFSKLLLNPRVGPLNDDQRAYTQDVVQSAEHLLQLINDILDLSKIEAGKMHLELESLALTDLLEQSLTIVREEALAHKLQLSTQISSACAEAGAILADGRKIKQVMYNLLSNAVKFTPDGGSITISADCSEGGRELIISVQDSGVGVPTEHQARIFHAFEQVDSSYTRQQQGTGLGLALTRRIVELHGGRIWLQSVEGSGSTFSFSLPLPSAETNTDSVAADADSVEGEAPGLESHQEPASTQAAVSSEQKSETKKHPRTKAAAKTPQKVARRTST